jgi:hypothetical protein
MSSNEMLEFVNPAKLCLALWFREFTLVLRNYNPRSHDMDDSEAEWLQGELKILSVFLDETHGKIG